MRYKEIGRRLSISGESARNHFKGMTVDEVIEVIVRRNPTVKRDKIVSNLNRKKGCYSTQEFANRIGVHKKTILAWMEKGKITPIFLPGISPGRFKGDARRWLAEDVDQIVRESYDTWESEDS